MNTHNTAEVVVENQGKETQVPVAKSDFVVGTTQSAERHFLVPEFKVRVVKRNRSFELGYN